jgi:hypothetical protein
MEVEMSMTKRFIEYLQEKGCDPLSVDVPKGMSASEYVFQKAKEQQKLYLEFIELEENEAELNKFENNQGLEQT